MFTIALSLLGKFWKPILLGILIIGLGVAINRWDNKRLDSAYNDGYNAAISIAEKEEKRIIQESEKITQEMAREFGLALIAQKKEREIVYEQINTYVKETVFECRPDAEYLRLYDNATRNPLNSKGTSNPSNRTKSISEGSGPT